jgi:hypothetical protein
MSELIHCPYCNKAYKSVSAYRKHVNSCDASPERQKLFADLAIASTDIENARLTAKDLPEFLFALSKAMATVGIKINYEQIPDLVLMHSGYGYDKEIKGTISVPKNLLTKGYTPSYVNNFNDLCRNYYFIPGFPNLEKFRWWGTNYLEALPAVAAQIKNNPIKQIDEHLVKVNTAITNYNDLVVNTASRLINDDPTIIEISAQKAQIQKALKLLDTIASSRKAEITSSVRNNRINDKDLIANSIPSFYNHLSTLEVDLFAKEELEKVKNITKKANDYIAKYPELWL